MITRGELEATSEWLVDEWPHTCTILRRAVIEQDPYRQDVHGEHEPYLTDVTCYFWWRSGGERHERRAIVEYEYRIQLPLDTDVSEDDIIDDVYDVRAMKINERAMSIQSIGHRSTHLVLVLKDVSSGT